MINQVTDTRSIVATLRRRGRLLVAAALVGFALGIGYVLALPPPVTSTTLVLLPTPAVSDVSNSDVETQVRIALSASILERAGQAVAPPLSARSMKKMVNVSAPTNQVIQIETTSRNPAEAQKLSQAMADAYVGYVSNTAREVTAAALADLTVRRDALKQEIAQVDKQIVASAKRERALDPNSPEGTKEAQLSAGLRTQHADLSVQLDRVQDKIVTGGPADSSGSAGTSIMQPATLATGIPALLRLLFWGSLGSLICTLLAAIVLLAMASRDPRLRLRDDIADAVGSSVLAAVQGRPQVSVAGWAT
jgi:capsular polysaccharide biosynthesis protein